MRVRKDITDLAERFDSLTERFLEIEQYNIIMDELKIKMIDKKNANKFKET